MKLSIEPELPLEVTALDGTSIIVSHNSKRIWVNVDGACILRITNPSAVIELTDHRPASEASSTPVQ